MAAPTATGNINDAGSDSGSSALGILMDRQVVHSLQPNLYFEQLCDVRMPTSGNFTDRFGMFDQISTSSVTTLSTEGTAPSAQAIQILMRDITPTQYGISVTLTDLVVLTSFFDLIMDTSVEVQYAMARSIDATIQTVGNAGTNVLYAGNKSARASLANGDIIDLTLVLKGAQKVNKGSGPTFPDGYFRAVGTVEQIYDLRANNANNQFMDVSKYVNGDNIKQLNGEQGTVHGVRIMQSPNTTTFSSTVTVHPMLVAGRGGVRLSYWLPEKIRNYVNHPEQTSISNQLGQLGNVGAKANIGAKRTQEARLCRLETGSSVSL